MKVAHLLVQIIQLCAGVFALNKTYKWRRGNEWVPEITKQNVRDKFLASVLERLVPTETVRVKVKSTQNETKPNQSDVQLTEREGCFMQIILLHPFDESLHHGGEEFECIDVIDETASVFDANETTLCKTQGENLGKSLKNYLNFVADKFTSAQPCSVLSLEASTNFEDFCESAIFEDSRCIALKPFTEGNFVQEANFHSVEAHSELDSVSDLNESCVKEFEYPFQPRRTSSNISLKAFQMVEEDGQNDSAYGSFNRASNESIGAKENSLATGTEKQSQLHASFRDEREREFLKDPLTLIDSLISLRNCATSISVLIKEQIFMQKKVQELDEKANKDEKSQRQLIESILSSTKSGALRDFLTRLLDFQQTCLYQKELLRDKQPTDLHFSLSESATPICYEDCVELEELLQAFSKNYPLKEFPASTEEFISMFQSDSANKMNQQQFVKNIECYLKLSYERGVGLFLHTLYKKHTLDGQEEFYSLVDSYRSQCAHFLNQLMDNEELIAQYLEATAVPELETNDDEKPNLTQQATSERENPEVAQPKSTSKPEKHRLGFRSPYFALLMLLFSFFAILICKFFCCSGSSSSSFTI